MNRVSIFSMIFMCFMKLNARFTPLSLRKALMSHFLMLSSFRRKNEAKLWKKSSKEEVVDL